MISNPPGTIILSEERVSGAVTTQTVWLILLSLWWLSPLHASAENISVESATWRFEFNNDLFFEKDNKISSGLSLQRHSAVAQSWDALLEVPDFVRRWGKAIPTLTDDGLVYRAGIALGQIVQTPTNLARKDLIEDDVPYAGVLTLQSSWYAFNDAKFRGFELTVGILGPASLAEHSQKIIHYVLNNDPPEGWDNQLKTELLLNMNYMRKRKIGRIIFAENKSFDISVDAHIALGNLFTKVSTGLEMRYGYNIPPGFLYMPDPIGFSMHYKATLKLPNPRQHSLYGSLMLSTSAFAHNILLDGNTFRNSHSVDREIWVAMVVLGLHYERHDWGIHFNLLSTSNNVDTDKIPAAEGREQLGMVDFEWRF